MSVCAEVYRDLYTAVAVRDNEDGLFLSLLFAYLVVRRRLHARGVHRKVVHRGADDALRPRLVLRRHLVRQEVLRGHGSARRHRRPAVRHGVDRHSAPKDGDDRDEGHGHQQGLGGTPGGGDAGHLFLDPRRRSRCRVLGHMLGGFARFHVHAHSLCHARAIGDDDT